MVKGLAVVAVMVMCGCADDAPDAGDPSSCSDFIELETRWWRKALPYIEPTSGIRIFVAGADFRSIWGQSDPQSDGTTLVWAPKKFHFKDGTIELGAAGNRDPANTTCEWVVPVRVE